MLEVGTTAPDFELPDQDGNMHKLSDYIGKKVILYFYPKDNTPGCTKQACAVNILAVLFFLALESVWKPLQQEPQNFRQ